ncbi:hypothetical protein PCK1_003181 [Pneumocystis canis]|nr:hypothetical protein PCK1_003181 [Pneumocystis canis]
MNPKYLFLEGASKDLMGACTKLVNEGSYEGIFKGEAKCKKGVEGNCVTLGLTSHELICVISLCGEKMCTTVDVEVAFEKLTIGDLKNEKSLEEFKDNLLCSLSHFVQVMDGMYSKKLGLDEIYEKVTFEGAVD